MGITYQTIDKAQLGQFLGGIDGNERFVIIKFFKNKFGFIDKTIDYWVKFCGWKDQGGSIFVTNQDENIKNKNITEKIDFENVAGIMATCI